MRLLAGSMRESTSGRETMPDHESIADLETMSGRESPSDRVAALDLGCGSGRHIQLLIDLGFHPVHGIDTSENSVRLCRSRFPGADFLCPAPEMLARNEYALPHGDAHFQVVVLWGVLHYNSSPLQNAMLAEVRRMLVPGGCALGTLRAHGDTHFRNNADVGDAAMQYFTEDKARELLYSHFDRVEIGYMERTPVGDLSRRICHWIFRAIR